MKKCPFCAEKILNKAIVCKHCKRSLIKEKPKTTKEEPLDEYGLMKGSKAGNKTGKIILAIIGVVFLIIINASLLYLLVPGVILWYLWKKSKVESRKKKIYSVIIILTSLSFLGIITSLTPFQSSKVPVITISEPDDNHIVQVNSVLIKGTIDPPNSIVTINNIQVEKINNQSDFTYLQPLNEEKNIITIVALNIDKSTTKTLTINRIFTEEEILEKQRLDAEKEEKRLERLEAQKKAEEEKIAKEKAEQAVWDASSAGKMCKKHPEWTKDECTKLANNKVWIGMSISMLKERRGLPNSANPSNYGAGTHWQWCWHDYTPSCFYDNNEDGLIDSYN